MNLHPKSAWSKNEVCDYLDQTITPLRISCNGSDGYPIICSLWYIHHDGVLWSASHKNSHVIKALQNNPKVGFEVATNEFPYHGVRGRADVTLLEDKSEAILEKVIKRYLKGSNHELAEWLMSRQEDEFAIKISPVSVNSWDFSARMVRQR